MKPTPQQIDAFQAMFDHFNDELFGSSLPEVILNFSRHARALGFFAPQRWESQSAGARRAPAAAQVAHEISLNPSFLKKLPLRDVASTLVHEMVHLWQQEHGEPSRAGYHNREWAQKMEDVGLMPSSTGASGGKRTGQRMSHYIIPGGPFDVAFDALPEHARFPWLCDDLETKKKRAKKNKLKYTCEGCGTNVWGKPDLVIACRPCGRDFEPEERADEDEDENGEG